MPAQMSISDDKKSMIITIEGEFGRDCLTDIRNFVSELSEDLDVLHFDLADSPFMDSDVSRYLTTLWQTTEPLNIKLTMATTNQSILTTINLMGISKHFEIVDQ